MTKRVAERLATHIAAALDEAQVGGVTKSDDFYKGGLSDMDESGHKELYAACEEKGLFPDLHRTPHGMFLRLTRKR